MDKFNKRENEVLRRAIQNTAGSLSMPSSPKTVAAEIVDLYDTIFAESCKKKISDYSVEKELVYIKLAALRYYLFSLSIPREKSKALCLISILFTHISNTIVSVLKLTDDGLDYQAFSLMRNLMELYILLLTAIESPQKREEFQCAVDDKAARSVWHRYFNKKHFIQMLELYFADNADAKEACKTWVENTYSELSSFAHNDYVHLTCYTLAVGEDEVHPLNLWGEYVSRRKGAYQHLVEIIAPAETLLSAMLNDAQIDINISDLFDEEDPTTPGVKLWQESISKSGFAILMDLIEEDKRN